MKASDSQSKLKSLASTTIALSSARFFKTGRGQYGEGDVFIGVRVPVLRQVASEYALLPLQEVDVLLCSAVHEERLLALLILVRSLNQCDDTHRKLVYDFYVSRAQHVNNWDLVDTSAPAIVGGFLMGKSHKPLVTLSASKNLWERRIAIVATQFFIRHGEFDTTLLLSHKLLSDSEDLIHKAVGWMLREVGQRDESALLCFLEEHAATMPRTMLRYSIERLPTEQRKYYMARKHRVKR